MILEYRPNHKMSLFAILIIALAVGVFIFSYGLIIDEPFVTFCSQEAKRCPDGSSVGRSGPDCLFADCPTQKMASGTFGNDQAKEAIIEYLLSQKHFSWKTTEGSSNFCEIENLGPADSLFPLYIWAYCGEYILRAGELVSLSGMSGPAKIDYPNELSFYDPDKFSYEAPGDGARYAKDIEKIFPKDVQEKIRSFNRDSMIKRAETVASAELIAWESVKQAIKECEVKQVFQAHSRKVTAELKNKEKLSATEPVIDDIIDIAVSAEKKCGKIIMATE